MDSKLILDAARGTLDGTLSFPEVVGQLLAAGVEYYHVDYVGLRKRFYSAEGEMMATSINYEGLPPVATEFDAAALRAFWIGEHSRLGCGVRRLRRTPCGEPSFPGMFPARALGTAREAHALPVSRVHPARSGRDWPPNNYW